MRFQAVKALHDGRYMVLDTSKCAIVQFSVSEVGALDHACKLAWQARLGDEAIAQHDLAEAARAVASARIVRPTWIDDDRLIRVGDLIGHTEAAAMVGVRVQNLGRVAKLPESIMRLKSGNLYDASEIRLFADERNARRAAERVTREEAVGGVGSRGNLP